MRLYVACLSSYNAGNGHGVWVTPNTKENLMAQIGAMLASSPAKGAEEWQVLGMQGAFGIDNIDDLATFYGCQKEHGETIALAALQLSSPIDLELTCEKFHGAYEDLETFAHEFFEGLDDYEEFKAFLDVDKVIRTKRHEGWRFVKVESGEFYVFTGGRY